VTTMRLAQFACSLFAHLPDSERAF